MGTKYKYKEHNIEDFREHFYEDFPALGRCFDKTALEGKTFTDRKTMILIEDDGFPNADVEVTDERAVVAPGYDGPRIEAPYTTLWPVVELSGGTSSDEMYEPVGGEYIWEFHGGSIQVFYDLGGPIEEAYETYVGKVREEVETLRDILKEF